MTYHPLNQSQMGIYLTCLNSQEEGNYNLGTLHHLDADIDTARLAAALDAVIAAHPYVKSRLVLGDDGTPQFEDRGVEEFHTSVLDVVSLDEVRGRIGAEYDLLKDPLFRLEIYRTSDDGNWLYADFHHIIFDGLSWSVLRDDLSAAYDGQAPEPESVDGFEIAGREASLRASESYKEASEWYAKEFAAADELDSMPLPDIQDGGEEHFVKYWEKLDIDRKAVKDLCGREKVKESTVYTAAFAFTLARYICEDEVLFTSAYHGRSESDTRRSFCMMVKTLPVYSNLKDVSTVSDLLRRTQEQTAGCRRHSVYSFADAHGDLGINTDVSFVYQGELHNLDISLCGKTQRSESLITHTPGLKFLGMLMIEDGVPYIWSEYQSNRYSPSFIRTFWESYACAVNEMCRCESLSDIELCTPAQTALLDSFNAHWRPYEGTQTVLDAFIDAAQMHPDGVAVIYKDKQLTYKELDEVTSRIGSYIRSKVKDCGKSEPVVSIIIGRSELMAVLPIAAMKAGCAYQPLDPSYPPERLNFMVKDADAALLIADPGLRDIVNEYTGEVLLTDALDSLEPATETLPGPAGPGSLFILLYTSGSTGVPKGVMLEHRNLMAFCRWYQGYYSLDASCRAAAYASFGFDADMMDLYPALTCGASVVIVPEEIRLDLIALEDYFNANGVTHSFITTQVGVQFLQSVENCPTLRHLSVGGEKLISIDPPTGFAFHNLYGPTECTVFVTIKRVEKNEPNIPIGAATGPSTLMVCDKHLRRLPVGAAGELIIIGDQVGRGYLNLPDKTAEAFFTVDGKRAYHSGDIVRYRPDGDIEFVGRRDGQVKIRGFRIELKEVEAVIREHPAVTDCTVQAFDDPSGGKYIAAYVCVASGADFSVEDLNAFILERKPPYMVPAYTMVLDRIPLNVNQKVDRKALPMPQTAASEVKAAAAPLNDLEKQLKEIIAPIVKTDDFSITEPLGMLGLTSVSSIKLSVQIFKKYGVQLESRTLAKTGTLQSIENQILAKLLEAPAEPDSTPKEKACGPARLCAPLSFTQQGVYAECQAHPGSLIYNMPVCLDFAPGVEAETVRAAVLQVLAAHPYMACRFVADEDGQTVQEPIPGFKPEVPVLEMTDTAFAERRGSFVQPFDLAEGPLFRYEVVSHEGRCSLLGDVHHLVGDGSSIDLLDRQICAAVDGQAPQAEEYSYYDFVRDLKEDPDAESYFDATIGGVEEVSRLVPDIFDEAAPHRVASQSVSIDAQAIEACCHSAGVTPAAFFLAAAALTVSRYLCEEEVSLATISGGRSNLRISDTVGMFVGTLPLALNAGTRDSVSEYISRTAAALDAAISHENYPFSKVASKYGFNPGISYACQMGVLEPLQTLQGRVSLTPLSLDTPKLPLALYVNGSFETGIELVAEWDTGLYSADFIGHFLKSLRNVALALPSASTLGDISLTDADDVRLLDSFNPEFFDGYDHGDTSVSIFRKMVAAFPDKTAAVFKDKRYTYRELDEETDRLAGIIYERMVAVTGKEDLREEVVSIIIDRSEWVFLLPLAVLKTGCAYEPLDPSYPATRLNYMVSDAGARLLIGEPALVPLVDEYRGSILLTSDFGQHATESRLSKPRAGDLMLMLYTSGSTGNPKGVQIEHGNIVAFVTGAQRSGFYSPDTRTAAYASFGFDVCMMDIFCTLLSGGTLYVIPEEMRLELARIKDYLDTEGITQIFMTTQVGVQFLQSYPQMKTLRYLSMGGEKLPAVHPEGLSYKILNGYGPTENTCGVSQFPIERWEPNIPLGKPMPTILGYVLDKAGHRLPPGACGEYCVAGRQPARGYLGLPEKTEEVFVSLPAEMNPTPFEGLRLYHTGDVVRYRENGDVEFVGRKDGMVKIRGFRIELKEVEAAIRPVPGVKDVTVQAYDYETGGKYLAAFVVADSPDFDTKALLEYVKKEKPPYMVPATVTLLERIPLTVNQKVDKKALPKPQLAAAEYVAPRGKEEEDFCAIFGEILGIEKVSADADFFEIGGSSIIALKVVIAAGKRGYEIVYNDVFSYPTPQQMALHLGGDSAEDAPAPDAGPAQVPSGITETDPDGYDYRAVNALLRGNTLDAFRSGENQPLGDVLLAGATGFLGVHVLGRLIESGNGRIWCFVRAKAGEAPEQRLQKTLKHYFGRDFAEIFGTRIFIVEGDATDPKALDGFTPESEGLTVINCAASVKHFAKGDEIERVNVGSVRNLVAWCIRHSARLVHVSTGSIFGVYVSPRIPGGFTFNERMFYVGQTVDDNQYVHSKFMAERLIYEGVLRHGLNAKVMRVGNLSPRLSDGRFQQNYATNNFMSSLAAYCHLGMIPYEAVDSITEFSPIDEVARAILLLSTTPRQCVCFMPSNLYHPHLGDIVMQFKALGRDIRMVEADEFASAVQAAIADPATMDKMRPFLAYSDGSSDKRPLGPDVLDVNYTAGILHRLGFKWSLTGEDYVQKFLRELDGLGFFG